MTKKQLVDKIKSRFTIVGPEKQGAIMELGKETITHWTIPTFDIVNDVLVEKWIPFYTDEEGNAYWQVREPKPTPVTPEPPFAVRVNSFIESKIEDNTIKFGYVDQYQEGIKKALVKAIDNSGSERQAVVSEDIEGNFSINIL